MTTPTENNFQPQGHPETSPGGIGVLIVNLGTPDEASPSAVRRYLAEFLSDRRVVDYPRLFWLPLLYGVILNVRPARSAKAYAKIWTEDESPLRHYTKSATAALTQRLGDDLQIDWAMRYGSPSIADKINALKKNGCDRILIIPMYPQYSQSTSASVADAAFRALQEMNWQPALRVAAPFYDAPAYIHALKQSAENHLAELGWEPDHVIISFHGTPKRHHTDGDPYYCQCSKTARLLREAMGWTPEFAPLAFQSKFGREEWLTPATDATIEALAAKGAKRLAVITPGFVADCLETLEELAIEARKGFLGAGGEAFSTIPCLNDSPEFIDLLQELVELESSGWTNKREI